VDAAVFSLMYPLWPSASSNRSVICSTSPAFAAFSLAGLARAALALRVNS